MKWFKRHTGILAIVELIIIIGLATSTILLAVSKNNTTSKAQGSTKLSSTTTQIASTAYTLGACKSGATQTIDNASYVVGTDIAPGSYKVVSQTGDIGWTNINVYNSKSEWVKQDSPSVEQGKADQSFEPNNGTTTYTKLSDGQFMQIDGDPATFTCQ